jgi:regulator of protease activity HflC (stomatin/prohibitin superfamily)
MVLTLVIICAAAAAVVLVFATGFRIVNEYERGIVFRLGRYARTTRPGLRYVLPLGIERIARVDARTGVTEIPVEVTTADHMSVRVVAAMHTQVLIPRLALTKVADYKLSTLQTVQTALRSVINRVTLQVLLTGRTFVNDTLQRLVDEETELWGVKVSSLELKEVQLSKATQRALGLPAAHELSSRLARTEVPQLPAPPSA